MKTREAVSGNDAATDKVMGSNKTLVPDLSVKLQEMPDKGRDRVEALTVAIREGRYSVSPEQIALSLLSNMVVGSQIKGTRVPIRETHKGKR